MFFFNQRNLLRTKYNTAITYKSSPSFLYIFAFYSVHTLAIHHAFFIVDFLLLFSFSSKRQEVGSILEYSDPAVSLGQRVYEGLFVSTWQQLLLLVCARQRVATVVSSHVQSGVDGVCEVGGLENVNNNPSGNKDMIVKEFEL